MEAAKGALSAPVREGRNKISEAGVEVLEMISLLGAI